MIKALASKTLAFSDGSVKPNGMPAEVIAHLGFCELPDWVADTDLFKMAVEEGSLKPFVSSGESEAVLKAAEEADKKKKAK